MAGVILGTAPKTGTPILSWRKELPSSTLRQLQILAAQPWVVERVVAMPDAHVAGSVAVGTVFATEDRIVPSALGADLGCGMTAAPVDFPAASFSRQQLERWLSALERRFPSGDKGQHGKGVLVPDELMGASLSTSTLEHSRARLAPRHLGTVGGGNHFVELDRDGGGVLWVLVHSGSRGLGGAIGHHHCRAAESRAPGPLPTLRADSEEGRAFLNDLAWALQFARANRARLLEQSLEILSELAGEPLAVDAGRLLDVGHNFMSLEEHEGRRLWVHRKGAIPAPAGGRALIPGSSGTASYVVEGLGERLSFGSASHGAGRVLSRREARDAIRPKELERQLRRVVFDTRLTDALVEEAPSAYRDISEVLEEQADLVRPLVRLEPVAVFKGR